MAEGGTFSQDLPLSEETCRLLFQQLIQDSFTGLAENVVQDSFTDLADNEDITIPQALLNVPLEGLANPIRPLSSLPASENWPGDFNFHISFKKYENIKGLNWIFAKDQNKLFVGRDVPCPIQFSTTRLMPDDVFIRATALFSTSEHSSEVVTRCLNHSVQEMERGIFEAEHIIRCESRSAVYVKDPITNQHSVLIPFENPAVGEQFSSYIFKFMCFGSCAGGPNRRPLMLVFTLEKRGQHVIGRQKVDLKICACPHRDYRSEEKILKTPPPQNIGVPFHKSSKRPNQDMFDVTPESLLNLEKKLKIDTEKCDKGEPYVIKVWDKRCYDFLRGMKRFFRAYVLVKKHYPKVDDLVRVFSSMSSSD